MKIQDIKAKREQICRNGLVKGKVAANEVRGKFEM